jgi:hypothetical protein
MHFACADRQVNAAQDLFIFRLKFDVQVIDIKHIIL